MASQLSMVDEHCNHGAASLCVVRCIQIITESYVAPSNHAMQTMKVNYIIFYLESLQENVSEIG